MKNKVNEKPTNFKESLRKVIKYSKEYKTYIILGIVFAILTSIISVIGPSKLRDMSNIISEGLATNIDIGAIKSVAIFLLIIFSVGFIFSYSENYIMAVFTNKFSKKLRKEISEKINRLPLRYFDNTSYGDILSRVTNDVDTLSTSLNSCLSSIFGSITLFVGSLVIMIFTSGILAVTTIVTSLFGIFGVAFIVKRSQKYFAKVQKDTGELNGNIEEIYSGISVVKLYNATDDVIKDFDVINDSLYNNVKKSQFLSGIMHPLMAFIGNFSYVCICIIGAILVINNQIDFGAIVAFMIYVRIFSNSMSDISNITRNLQSGIAASERVFDFLDVEEQKDESSLTKKLDKKDVKGKIDFEHVNFGYNDDKLIIKDFNCNVLPGQKIALVGETGAGKTTMVNLLMKFYDINDGDIKIDDVSIKELTRENIHDLFIMVLQDTWNFEGTIKDNIKYNKKNVSDKQIRDICKVIGLDHFIMSLPKGYDTMLSDNDLLSSGQKQLLTIARGMIEGAPFLILDEATSSVDTITEEMVSKAMDKLTEGRTSFIIAHRLSTIKNADIILMLENGNIVEKGTHDELMKLDKKYAALYKSQFEKIK